MQVVCNNTVDAECSLSIGTRNGTRTSFLCPWRVCGFLCVSIWSRRSTGYVGALQSVGPNLLKRRPRVMHENKTNLIHLICGSTGAGKTTYAQDLADDISGIIFSIDEWMVSLFGEDAPKDLSPAWFVPRVSRCENQMWAMALQLGKLGIPSILDFGFQRREHRQRYTSLARASQLPAKLHFLDVDASMRWKRVQSRNENQGRTFQMKITRNMFDYIETIWEPPSNDELKSISAKD